MDATDSMNKAAREFARQITQKESLKRAGFNAMFKDELPDKLETQKAIDALTRVSQERSNVSKELMTYRKYVPALLKYIMQEEDCIKMLHKHIERMTNDSEDKKYQRWTPEEEETLIDMVCSGRYSMIELSTTLGRTVPAIKTKLSNLVGIKRLSQEVAGKFIGTLNGNTVEGSIDGTVFLK